MKTDNNIKKNIIITTLILIAFLGLSYTVAEFFDTLSLVPALGAFAVFLISLITNGYVYGIIASLFCVLVLNFAFTFPFFKFNFTIPENLVSALIMLAITFMSCTLATQVKQQEKINAENAKEKLRANLLRAVSHDLRTPLTTIYGSSQTIINQYDQLSKDKIIQLATGIKEDSEWLVRMVENLLSVTKLDSDGVNLNKSPTVLEELIDTVIIKFKKRFSGQEVLVDIPDEFICIPMDAVLIEQVILNILENAVQYAIGMTELKLKVFTMGDNAIFEISDDGCGIPKDMLPDIFTGFFEKKESHVDIQKNCMGIGLSVCASIIKAHDGKISVENRKTGGCCFRFSLKLEETFEDEQE